MVSDDEVYDRGEDKVGNVLDTARVQRRAIHRCGNHVSE